jgi:hypothetical protein
MRGTGTVSYPVLGRSSDTGTTYGVSAVFSMVPSATDLPPLATVPLFQGLRGKAADR